MKVTLTIEDRELGLVLKLLGHADNSKRNSLGEPCPENARWAKGQIAQADRIRAIRKDLSAQRKAQESIPDFLRTAERIARAAHSGQIEESTGDPYIRHIERVVAMVYGDETKAVAWLHDVIEDTPFRGSDLIMSGVPDRIIRAVSILSRVALLPYADYIESVKESGDALAIAVKIADLRDHLRPNCPGRLRERYERACAVFGISANQDQFPAHLVDKIRKAYPA